MKAKLWLLRLLILAIGGVMVTLLVLKIMNGEEPTPSNWLSVIAIFVSLLATFIPDIGSKKRKQLETAAVRYLDHAFDDHKKEKEQFLRGFAFWDQGKYAQAIEALEKLCKTTDEPPIYARAKAHIGRCYLDAQQYAAALKAYEEAVEYDHSFVLAWSNLATVYDKMGAEPEKCVRALEMAIYYDPDYEIAYNKLGMYYGLAGNNEKSEWAARIAVRLNPKRKENHSNLAWSLCALGRGEEAEESYLKALQLGYKDDDDHLANMIRKVKAIAVQQKANDGVLGALRQAKYNHDHGVGGPLDEDSEDDDD